MIRPFSWLHENDINSKRADGTSTVGPLFFPLLEILCIDYSISHLSACHVYHEERRAS